VIRIKIKQQREMINSLEEEVRKENETEENSKTEVNTKITASLIIIGDEILKGHTKDANATFLLGKLWSNGVEVKRTVFLPDDIDVIAKEVLEFSRLNTFVITAGGIGPTHDDMTYEAIAKAFGETTYINDQISKCLETITKKKITKPLEKMARIPTSSKIIIGIDPITKQPMQFPLLQIQNVFVFPGVPEYLRKSFQVNEHLFTGVSRFLLMKIFLSAEESTIADALEHVNSQFESVHIGSYPMLNGMYKVKLTLESEHSTALNSAYEELIKMLPNDIIVSVRKCLPNERDVHQEIFATKSPVKHHATFMNSLSLMDFEHYMDVNNTSPLSEAIKCACAVFNQTVLLYNLDEVCVGFNGGKDCTAVLHLYIAYLKKMFPDNTNKLVALYLECSHPFQEATDFMRDCETNYGLEMIAIPGSIKEGLAKLKETHPKIKAVIMGTRRHDPYSNQLRSFSMTDKSWPQFMRILPILDWTYCEVWEFLKHFDLPYCKLYDQGYTSLGSEKNTLRNPALKLADGRYSPAFLLKDGEKERHGREKPS